ncbi:DUF3703 domain-containing protein [Paraglaciecola sp. Hal342]|jgi:hypothetical protein
MMNKFARNIADDVKSEILLAEAREAEGFAAKAFQHLESAHVLGQESTWWHVKVHCLMFSWAVRQNDVKECFGQLFRIIGAISKTALGLVPAGNTGGTNVSPFKKLPIKPEHQAAITKAKQRT